MVLLIITWGHTTKQHKNFMRKLLLLTPLLLMGCGIGMNNGGGGGGSFSYMDTGGASSYSCEEVTDPASYCATGEHPNLCDC